MKKWIKRITITIISLLICGYVGFMVYVSNYYHAVDADINPILSKENVTKYNNITQITHPDATIGFIFYPGGKVEASAYLPLLDTVCAQDINCYLVEMPYNLAVFDKNAAAHIIVEHPEVNTWYIGGHSLGGAMASDYYANHPETIDGLILLGSYIYGNVDPQDTLTIYGSNDWILDTEKITYDDNVYVIEGGNHAGFGNYGIQKKDGPLSTSSQQEQTSNLIHEFMLSR